MKTTHGIPNLKLDRLLINGDGASTELDTNRQIMLWMKASIGELQQQAALSHSGISNDNVLEGVCG
jgi:hypothetical protein